MDQAMIKKLGIILGAFVGFIFLLFILSSCSNKTYTHERLEQQMIQIAQNYYKTNEKDLPSQDKDSRTYTLKKMISDGKLEEVTELFKDENKKCDGNVTVTNNNGNYLYTPYLSCGKDYTTTYLKDKIIEDNLVEVGVGLYEIKDQYIFKGETLNNFVKFNDMLFRIIRINEDGSIRVLQLDNDINTMFDDRYNEDQRLNFGINDYIVNSSINSRIKDSLEDYYNSAKWSTDVKAYIPTQTLCIGKRSTADVTLDGTAECSVKLENQNFGALAIYEYLQGTLDPACSNTLDVACKNYNWFAAKDARYWSLTGDAENSSKAFYIQGGRVADVVCKTKTKMNVVFNITDKAVYDKGTGTREDPYTLQVVTTKK